MPAFGWHIGKAGKMFLIVGDLHLTDHARDQYRFGIFRWIRQQQEKYPVAATFLLGDLTDAKDKHSATLVNKIVSGLTSLQPPVYILMGNHDYKADQSNPFFKFLNHIEGIKFVYEPLVVKIGVPVAMVPHYRSQDEFNDAVRCCAGVQPVCFLVHQTFDGAIAETGVRLSGLAASPIELLRPRLGVYAGDVHRPQTQGIVTYVGCPYQVRFGDSFSPRVLLHRGVGGERELYYPAPYKWSLLVQSRRDLRFQRGLCEGDQVKIEVELAREEVVEWKTIRKGIMDTCKEMGLEIYGIKMKAKLTKQHKALSDVSSNPTDIFKQFCKSEKLPSQISDTGMEILNGSKNIL
jgi:hypothetical protein